MERDRKFVDELEDMRVWRPVVWWQTLMKIGPKGKWAKPAAKWEAHTKDLLQQPVREWVNNLFGEQPLVYNVSCDFNPVAPPPLREVLPPPQRLTKYALRSGAMAQKRLMAAVSVAPPIMDPDANDMLDIMPSFGEVATACTSLNSYRAPGHDGMTAEFLRFADMEAVRDLWHVIEESWKSESIPDAWRLGVVPPILKPGGLVTSSNFRPITLLPVINRLFTCIMDSRLRRWCRVTNAVLPEQAGFLPQRSCADQVLSLLSIIRASKRPVFCCFIDVKKAFDSVWRDGL